MLLPVHWQTHVSFKDAHLCWFVGFYADNDWKIEGAVPLLQASRIGVPTATDDHCSHLPAQETHLFECFRTRITLLKIWLKRRALTLGLHLALFSLRFIDPGSERSFFTLDLIVHQRISFSTQQR